MAGKKEEKPLAEPFGTHGPGTRRKLSEHPNYNPAPGRLEYSSDAPQGKPSASPTASEKSPYRGFVFTRKGQPTNRKK